MLFRTICDIAFRKNDLTMNGGMCGKAGFRG